MPSKDVSKINATYLGDINGYEFVRVGQYLMILNRENVEVGRFTPSQAKEIAKTIANHYDFLVVTDPNMVELLNECVRKRIYK